MKRTTHSHNQTKRSGSTLIEMGSRAAGIVNAINAPCSIPHLYECRRPRKGQTIVEAAFVLPVLIMLSMLIVQFAIIMNASSTLTNLSREGARFAATQPALDDPIKTRIQQVCPPSIGYANITSITIIPAMNTANRTMSGQTIKVEIRYNMAKKAFLPTTFFGIPMFQTDYVAYTTMMIE